MLKGNQAIHCRKEIKIKQLRLRLSPKGCSGTFAEVRFPWLILSANRGIVIYGESAFKSPARRQHEDG